MRSPTLLPSAWRREALRTNLWLVPTVEIAFAAALFVGTHALDRAAYNGSLHLPSWVISGTADAARQILTAIAAAVITVGTLVFSITIVTLTLASTQFGPRMLRNFIRDSITQFTLGTFVATFVYAILALVSIGSGSHGDFVPHLSITVTMGLVLLDVAVLVLFIDHIAKSIQLPQVIAGDRSRRRPACGRWRQGWAVTGGDARAIGRGQRGRSGAWQRLPAVREHEHPDRHLLQEPRRDPPVASTGPLCRGGPAPCDRVARGRGARCRAAVGFRRLVERAHDKIRQASRGMPAVMIRQLDGLAKVMTHAASPEQREVLLEQAEMILRASEESVPEEADRADVRRRYDAVLTAASSRTMAPWPTTEDT
jgi:uncharacterized membrane protein